jgi:non-heme chloroperoxidase
VPPLMVQTDANPGGLPKSVFDGFQEQTATNRSEPYHDLAVGPFYGFNRPGPGPRRRSSRTGGARA